MGSVDDGIKMERGRNDMDIRKDIEVIKNDPNIIEDSPVNRVNQALEEAVWVMRTKDYCNFGIQNWEKKWLPPDNPFMLALVDENWTKKNWAQIKKWAEHEGW